MLARRDFFKALSLVVCLGIADVSSFGFQQQPLTPGGDAKAAARDPFTEVFTQLIEKGLQDWHVAGLAISIVDGNHTFAKDKGFGFATLPDVPATPETLWYVGSTTKAQTSATLATLIDSGDHSELSSRWKTPIADILRDDFVVQNEWATRHLTLEDAATHRTGMTRHDQSSIWHPDDQRGMVKDTVRNLRNLPFHIEPRTEFHYCNLFYTVLGHVVETLTGRWLGDVMREVIWKPLGMNSTYFELEDARAGPHHVSQGYTWHEDVGLLVPIPFVQSAVMNGAGAVISNVLDYAKWMRCLLNKDAPFSEAVHAEIRKPRMIADFTTVGSDVTTYSLSWFQANIYGRNLYWHSGSTMTHGALVYWFPDENYGITIFANSVTPLRQIIMYKLIEDRFNVPEDKRIDVEKKERASEKLMKEWRKNATDLTYPNRPSKPLPPTLNLADHVGTYHDAGYGSVEFYLGNHPSLPTETALIAERSDHAWNETVRMEHVTGDFWLWMSYIKEGPPEVDSFYKVEFNVGPDGRVSSFVLDNYDWADRVSQGNITFRKVT